MRQVNRPHVWDISIKHDKTVIKISQAGLENEFCTPTPSWLAKDEEASSKFSLRCLI
jgi:hypothetical protein